MNFEYIILICAGALFLFLIFLYVLVAFERMKSRRRDMDRILNSYVGDNLRKMEYDTAFYDEETFRLMSLSAGDRQVTIDDVLKENSADTAADRALFVHIEDAGLEEIKGNYDPESGND